MTFIPLPTRTYLSPFRGTSVDDLFTVARFVRTHSKAPREVQQAALEISQPSKLLIVLDWLSSIRDELSDEMREIAGGFNPNARGCFQYLVYRSQYDFAERPVLEQAA